MSVPAPEPLGVDTSIGTDPSAGFTTGTTPAGLESTQAPWLDQGSLFETVDAKDFADAFGPKPTSFAKTVKTVAKGNGTLRQNVVQYAKQFLGMYYKWGGSNPNTSFDCSGFTQYVLKKFGVSLPRVSFQQANYGQRISYKSAQAGDLIAWDNSTRNNGADHIALYLGGGKIMEFYRTGKPSRIRSLGSRENFVAVRIKYPGER